MAICVTVAKFCERYIGGNVLVSAVFIVQREERERERAMKVERERERMNAERCIEAWRDERRERERSKHGKR